jgi:anaerobic selenocysteine-containing dehydrogenase
METIRVIFGHDCSDIWPPLAHVEDGRILRIEGDPERPFTAGFACARVNCDAEFVNSLDRLTSPLRWVGATGEGKFASITWDRVLDEIATSWKAIIAESGPLALFGNAYSAHQRQMNRSLVNGLFYALGASQLQRGTLCDTWCEAAWDTMVGSIDGADPETVGHADLVISSGADLGPVIN